jgi:transcriptional regulator with XRE-family HTH domain
MNNLKKALRSKAMTEAEFARRLGTTNQRVNNWTMKKHKPNHDMMIRISALLGVSIEELFFSPQSPPD